MNRDRLLTIMAIAAVVLLGMNLWRTGPPLAEAAAPLPKGVPVDPHSVNGAVADDSGSNKYVWRFWSDGRLDVMELSPSGCSTVTCGATLGGAEATCTSTASWTPRTNSSCSLNGGRLSDVAD